MQLKGPFGANKTEGWDYKSSRTFKAFVKQPPVPPQGDYYIFFDGGGYSKGRVEPYPYYTHHRQKTCSNPLGVGRGQFGELFKSSGCLIFLLLFIFPCRRGRLGTIFRWRVARQVEEVA